LAVLSANGETAAEQVTQSTIEQYQKYVNLARTADRETFESLPTMSKFQVLFIRHRIPTDELLQMNGRNLLIHTIKNDWIGRNMLAVIMLGDIQVAGRRATAGVYIDKEKTPYSFQFNKEDKSWRFDMTHMLGDTEKALTLQIQQSGLSENEFLLEMVESAGGGKVENGIRLMPTNGNR
jgi:hypothetical protein